MAHVIYKQYEIRTFFYTYLERDGTLPHVSELYMRNLLCSCLQFQRLRVFLILIHDGDKKYWSLLLSGIRIIKNFIFAKFLNLKFLHARKS